MLFVGVDLAWGEGSATKRANETGLCVIDETGRVLDAGWARGVDEVTAWVLGAIGATGISYEAGRGPTGQRDPRGQRAATGQRDAKGWPDTAEARGPRDESRGIGFAGTADTGFGRGHHTRTAPSAESGAVPETHGAVIAVDAPLVVPNPTGMREAEKQVGRAYGRWKVACNPTNQALGWLAGVTLRDRLEEAGVIVVPGTAHPDRGSRVMFECYPYTTLVGMAELGYVGERPRYKRLDLRLPSSEARAARAVATDELIARVARLDAADPPLDLRSHPVTRTLVEAPSPLSGPAHKHREDLLDAALCAWTASIWARHGEARVQILGRDEPRDARGRPATIVAPARPEQRLAR